MILITGGCGFIGSNFISNWFSKNTEELINLDSLDYAADKTSPNRFAEVAGFRFIQGNIGCRETVRGILHQYRPRAVINFAAHTHVDNSIANPAPFITNNVTGFFNLLEEVREYIKVFSSATDQGFRFIQISTDEVFGSLNQVDPPFNEQSPYRPNSPYSASKAAADHIARAYFKTYDFPVIVTHCSNNFGPHQHLEKLIPLVVSKALSGNAIPLYGNGQNVRDWIFVQEHCDMIEAILKSGRVGEEYNLGGCNEIQNLDLVNRICEILDQINELPNGLSYKDQITFVKDRPGHDFRYAINTSKFCDEFSWLSKRSFQDDLKYTIEWYVKNKFFDGNK